MFVAALVAGGVIRLVGLYDLPLHFDEGNNAYFFARLVQEGHYQYWGSAHHGPFLYYASRLLPLRLGPACASVCLPLLLLLVRRELTWVGVCVAAWMMALCPNLAYYARSFIQESYLVFFTAAMAIGILAALHAVGRRRVVGAAVAGVSIPLAYTNKETAILAVFALAAALVWTLWRRDFRESAVERWRAVRRPFLIGLALGTVLAVILFSSLFSNPMGLWEAVKAPWLWLGEGGGIAHVKSSSYYASLLLEMHHPSLIFAAGVACIWSLRSQDRWHVAPTAIGAVAWIGLRVAGLAGPADLAAVAALSVQLLVATRDDSAGRFLSAWAVVTFWTYTLIPYKTPWLLGNALLPLYLCAGRIAQLVAGEPRAAALVAPALAVLPLWWSPLWPNMPVRGTSERLVPAVVLTWDVVHERPWDERFPLVYTATQPGFDEVVDWVERFRSEAVAAIHPEVLWPLRYYLYGLEDVELRPQVVVRARDDVVFLPTQLETQLTKETAGWDAYRAPVRVGVEATALVRASREEAGPAAAPWERDARPGVRVEQRRGHGVCTGALLLEDVQGWPPSLPGLHRESCAVYRGIWIVPEPVSASCEIEGEGWISVVLEGRPLCGTDSGESSFGVQPGAYSFQVNVLIEANRDAPRLRIRDRDRADVLSERVYYLPVD